LSPRPLRGRASRRTGFFVDNIATLELLAQLEPRRILEPSEVIIMKAKLEEFLTFLEVSLQALYITSRENVPTLTACLNAIRLRSPVSIDELSDVLQKKGIPYS